MIRASIDLLLSRERAKARTEEKKYDNP